MAAALTGEAGEGADLVVFWKAFQNWVRPVVFVTLRAGATTSSAELVAHCKQRLVWIKGRLPAV